jgi:two-component system sensor histidine kinase PilS (NtrC family)
MRRKLHWLLVARLVAAAVLLIAVGAAESRTGTWSFVPALAVLSAAILLLSGVYYLALRSRLSLTVQVCGQLTIDFLLITWVVYRTGDIESPFLVLYLVLIFAASALCERRETATFGALGAALYGAIGLATVGGALSRAAGWAPYPPSRVVWIEFMYAVNLVAIFVVTLLSSQLSARIRRSETELATATKDLADYRLVNDRIIESMRSGLVTTDLDGHIITFNRAAEEITGYKTQEVRGTDIKQIFGDIGKQIEAGLESLRTRSRLPRFDIGCRTANGREIHLGFSVSPLVDESERSRGHVLSFQDLTEVMELEREVRRQERLAALGKMAAGLAHEIRNPLASMRGSVQVLASELTLSPDQSQLMEIVLRESDRLNRIVSDFLTYARPAKIERTTIELSSILSETVALLRNSPELTRDHQIIEEYPRAAVLYNGDPNQLRQIFWNLARNAIQAMPLGGELKLKLDARAGREVTILFSDSGQGMTREQKERIFEPFNSTSGGTGLGMAIVYQLVRDHNGDVVVDSAVGVGTRISIKLPASGRIFGEAETEATETSRLSSALIGEAV